MTFYIAVLLGALIYAGFQLNGVFVKPDFSWKVFYKTNVVATGLNLIIGFALVFIKEELINIYPITLVSALILGFAGQGIFKKITDAGDKTKPTKIGLNA